MGAALTESMLGQVCRVGRIRMETSDTFTMELEPPDQSQSPRFQPGQFNMLYLFGVGEAPISIAGDPAAPGVLVHTTREVGSVTRAMRQLRPGDTIGVRGPYGTYWPLERAAGNDIVLVAGGIGLAPLRPLLYSVLASRERFGKVLLLYGTRTPEDILYRRELEKWRSHFDLEVYVTVDRATGRWRGSVGVVTTLIARAPFDPLNTTAFVCGPEVMMRFAVSELQRRGVQPEDTYLSLERNMRCAVGVCGHCQVGPYFVCKDGPVFRFTELAPYFGRREL